MNSVIVLFEKRLEENKDLTPKMKDILQASLELFAEKGYSNTSTKDVARAADVAEGTIFKHFASKENLLYATLIPLLKHTMTEEWQNQLDKVTKDIENYTFEEFLKKVLKNKIIYANDNIKVLKILYMEFIYQENLRDNLLSLIPEGILIDINNVLNYYKQEKQIADLSNKELFRFIAGTLMTFILANEMFPSSEETKMKELDNIIMFLIKGLAPNN